MTSELIEGRHAPIRTSAPVSELEPEARAQLVAAASLPWVAHHVAVMPDVHLGEGATVGSVLALRGAVAPAAVGVDIGCGMTAVKLPGAYKDIDRVMAQQSDLVEIVARLTQVVCVKG